MKKIIFSALLFLGVTGIALAQETAVKTSDVSEVGETLKVRHWSVLVKGGMHYFRTTTQDISEKHNLNGFQAGIDLQYDFNPLFGAGIAWTYNKFNRPYMYQSAKYPAWRSHTNNFSVFGSMNFTNLLGKYRTKQRFNFYGKAGIGVFYLSKSNKQVWNKDRSSIMMHFGFTAEWNVSRVIAFALGFEYDYYFKNHISGFNENFNNELYAPMVNDRQFAADDVWNATAGIRIKFGAKSKPHAHNVAVAEYYPQPKPVVNNIVNNVSEVDLNPLNKKISDLEGENAALKNRVGKLEGDLKALDARMKEAAERAWKNLEFDFNSSRIRRSSHSDLDFLATELIKNPNYKVCILSGHTDNVGSESYNQRLSERRAEAVKTYLVNKGVNAANIETRGYGESQPLASNDTAAGRQTNRRVVIEVKQ